MSLADDVVSSIDRDALIRFALEICNIDSAVPHEALVAEHIYQWMLREGFTARRIGLLPDRFNVMGVLPGTGGGQSLMFNGHLDTYAARERDLVHADPAAAVYHSAWQEGDLLVGEGIVNDKGPIAAFLMAAKAVKGSGHRLKGDLVLTCVIAETSREPFENEAGILRESKELGARFLVTHGGVADHVVVAEGTGFGLAWVEAGKFWYKVTLRSSRPPFYTPYLPERTTLTQSPNMIVAAAAAIGALENWAAAYQKRNTRHSGGGTIVPKVQIGAIRSGDPSRPILAPQLCELFIDVRALPGQDPLATRDEVRSVLNQQGLTADVDLYHFRPGYEAKNIERLAETVRRAHRATFGGEPTTANPETSSMWRDSNVFAELGIPAMSYGPRSATHSFKRALTTDSLYQAACVYARIALDLCNQDKEQADKMVAKC
jgi:acetylornithine deacetylase/succinyl-diaminopimelate desuccinylase-like protein